MAATASGSTTKKKKTTSTTAKKKSSGSSTTAKKKAPAKKPAASTAKSEPAKRGRKPRAGGLQSKLNYITKMFAEKGKSKAQAVAGLMTKYPDISENYARTIVYSYGKDIEGFAPSARGRKKGTPPKPTAKKKAAPVEDEEEFEDDLDLDEEEDEEDYDF